MFPAMAPGSIDVSLFSEIELQLPIATAIKLNIANLVTVPKPITSPIPTKGCVPSYLRTGLYFCQGFFGLIIIISE